MVRLRKSPANVVVVMKLKDSNQKSILTAKG